MLEPSSECVNRGNILSPGNSISRAIWSVQTSSYDRCSIDMRFRGALLST